MDFWNLLQQKCNFRHISIEILPKNIRILLIISCRILKFSFLFIILSKCQRFRWTTIGCQEFELWNTVKLAASKTRLLKGNVKSSLKTTKNNCTFNFESILYWFLQIFWNSRLYCCSERKNTIASASVQNDIFAKNWRFPLFEFVNLETKEPLLFLIERSHAALNDLGSIY